MSWFDLGALILVAFAVYDGAKHGLVWAVFQTALIVGAAVAARALHAPVEPYVQKVADLGPEELHCAAHVAVFAVAACALFGVLILIHPASKRWRFKRDGWFGAALGALNGAVAALLLFAMAMWCSPRRVGFEEAIAESRLVPVLRVAEEHGLAWVFPESLPDRLAGIRRP